ncbi:bacillithiol biosynthesis cysteine-adding enzyme BshC [Rudanella paleaurantiibacter]|uniref:Putative cysteine ligase BshC n=1 Tax=Rudanella paleaurantiibacter TaxID=2614655 RepID=A0A7J5U2I7_9BACT|nr:bacillithiol biosynthesis cysteine-adding enzyme BshC [Rudanella paleaurantiibacter]KAB7731896.1 bacillithiol biosynthesis cysteine-adding enzyme BshC [Rudanella paleaurantiibacter]
MDCQYLPLSATGQFSSFFLDYIARKEPLQPFYGQYPVPEAFGAQIKQKQNFSAEHRQTLVRVLDKQYATLAHKPDVSVLADPNTFTVTTGHQLNIFTGPLYVIYKLVTTINLAKRLAQAYPDYKFVPVYWMASEDHDFDEISHARICGRTYTWQTEQRGAVGRMNPRELQTMFAQIPEKLHLFEQAYLNHDTLADAVRYYMNELFGSEGLVCLDADDPELKQLFAPVITDELTRQTSARLVQQTTESLVAEGYEAVITPRDINLFYLTDGLRERIERAPSDSADAGKYTVVNTNWAFSEADLLQQVAEHPERFSPNVVLRPLYQETILPNLAYIGGPSEVPYWMQLKGVFDHYQTPFPLLMPRNFALYVPRVSAKRLFKLGMNMEEWFLDETKLKHRYVEHHTRHALRFDKENKAMHQTLDAMLHKAMMVDPTLERAVLAETKRFANAVERLQKKMRRAEERNQEVGVRQLLAVKQELFPGGGLQERVENFLTFYLNDKGFIEKLLGSFDPFDYRMQVCLEQ